MANIADGKIIGTGDYIDLETALSLSLVQGSQYSIQIQGAGTFCESATKPTSGGTFWRILKPFTYIKATDTLWLKVNDGDEVYINVSE